MMTLLVLRMLLAMLPTDKVPTIKADSHTVITVQANVHPPMESESQLLLRDPPPVSLVVAPPGFDQWEGQGLFRATSPINWYKFQGRSDAYSTL